MIDPLDPSDSFWKDPIESMRKVFREELDRGTGDEREKIFRLIFDYPYD